MENKEKYITEWSEQTAIFVVDDLVDHHLISQDKFEIAKKIVEEEIKVQMVMKEIWDNRGKGVIHKLKKIGFLKK